ncbi:MAG: ssl1498 family light-harvesting-like protein [Desertifilum sp.]|nr:ssl1498 family light-harvesting-like protein [Desertifilum sp.]
MYTTTNNEGTLNNYAAEPELYYAEYPSLEQQQRYMLQGAIAVLLVGFLLLTSFAVS